MIYEIIDRLEMLLMNNGSLIFKIWKGREEKEIIKKLKSMFESVDYFKPISSRQESSEIFIVATKYKYT